MMVRSCLRSFLPLVLLLGAAAAPLNTTVVPATRDGTPTTPPPAALLAQTDAMKYACRAWIPQLPKQPFTPSPPLARDVETRKQFDTCEMVLHAEQTQKMFTMLGLMSLWGGIMTLIVLFFLLRLVGRAVSRKFQRT